MKRVAHVLSFVGYGGGVQVSFRSYYSKVRTDTALHHHVYGTYPLSVHYSSIDRFDNLRASWPARLRFVRDLMSGEAVVHFYNYLCSAAVARVLQVIPARHVVMHERGASWNRPESAGRWARLNADHSDLVLANSEAARILITERWGVPLDRTQVVYNGVIPDHALSRSRAKRPPGGPFVVGYIGRLDSPKGLFSLLDAAAVLRGRPDIRFDIVGEGVLREELEGYASDRRVGECVRFLGGTRDPYAAISRFDVLAVPSIREPLGNVAIEAGVLGKAVIASAVDGLPEVLGDAGILLEPKQPLHRIRTAGAVPYPDVVVDPNKGKLVPPSELDPDELAEAIVGLANDEAARMELGERLSVRVRRLFTVDAYIRRMDELYTHLLRDG